LNYSLGEASNREVRTVLEPLARVVRVAITLTDVDFSVVEGIRSEEQQRKNIKDGVSWTMDSKHLTGQAVDIYPWANNKTSHDPEHYKRVAKAMFAAAQQLKIEIEWGGFWKDMREDCPHWELS
jgi:peptidoglycan L-alanyl-D-glutamate endopeptidase CwlK